MELLAVAGLAVLCLYAWRYGHIIVGVCSLLAAGLYAYALATGLTSLPGANTAPYFIAGGIAIVVWCVT